MKSEYPPVEEIIRLLIRFDADINAKEKDTNNTIFHLMNNKDIPMSIVMLLTSISPSSPYTVLNSSQLTASKVVLNLLLLF